jgi:acyl dehydratase
MTNGICFEHIEIGDMVPAFERHTDLMNWNRFAAVNDEFVYIHMDDDAARAAGQKGVFGMGNLRWAYVMNMLREWIGDEGEIRQLSMQYRAINYKHDDLAAIAVVTDKRIDDQGAHLVVLDVDVLNQNGDRTSPGRAVVAVQARVADAG